MSIQISSPVRNPTPFVEAMVEEEARLKEESEASVAKASQQSVDGCLCCGFGFLYISIIIMT